MELYRTFVKNGRVESERRELIQLLLFIKIFYYSFAKKIFYADEYSLKKNVEKCFIIKVLLEIIEENCFCDYLFIYIYIYYFLIKWFGCKMSKCKISTKYIIGKFENIYVYFSLFLFLSFAFDLAENLICTPKKKKKKIHFIAHF